ncbi:MAG: sodium:alanine symporter family protein [Methylococcales bacterium]
MEQAEIVLKNINSIIWGPFTLVILFGVGLYLTIGLKFMPWRKVRAGFLMLWQGRYSEEKGEITPFQALMTALSATIGTGNIAGVATAIAIGGPGAVFWMWLTALLGMATKFSEAVLAVKYREVDEQGKHVGGPMYYIKNGMGPRWRWLGFWFALSGMIAAFGIGNMVQANSVADVMESTFQVPTWMTGAIIALATAVVILGGVQRIAEVAAKLVPVMGLTYFVGSLVIIALSYGEIPMALTLIVTNAFNGTAATGGFAGATIWAAMQFGVARGVFSNEAGLGSAAIAHAAAKTNNAVRQGMIGMLGTFIDSLVICTLTALVIILTGVWSSGETGASLSALAFETGLVGYGGYLVTFGLIVFAFTTLLGWSYYGERCAEYIFGIKCIVPYRVLWIAAIPTGAVGKLGIIWLLADVMNGLMALPNLIALLVLSPVIFRVTRDYFRRDS